jgi:hypothetical protein
MDQNTYTATRKYSELWDGKEVVRRRMKACGGLIVSVHYMHASWAVNNLKYKIFTQETAY